MEQPIRVLHVIGIMNRGGAEAMIMNLYREVDKTKVQFDFVENSFEPAVYDEEILSLGGRIFRCPHFTGKNYFEYKKWWKDFFDEHQNEFAAVHGHLGSTAAIYLSEAKKHNIFTIAHSHSTNRMKTLNDYLYAVLSYGTRFIADCFFGCSKASGLSRYGKKVVNSSKYKTFNNAVDIEKYSFNMDNRNAVRAEFNVADGDILIGTIGRLTEAKNPKFIFEIFKLISKKNPNAKCIWVGTGEMEKEIHQWIYNANLQKCIITTGVRSDVNRLLQAFDCFVFPSLYEGLPVTVIEAQASGVHCLIADTITKETEVSDLINWYSLNQSAEEWADKAISLAKNAHGNERTSPIESLQKAGYDIRSTAKELTEFYLTNGK